jgi:hypothetical protein
MKRFRHAAKEYKAGMKEFEDGKRHTKPKKPEGPTPRMHADEPHNFLRFATALKILLASSVEESGLDRASDLLRDYLLGFREVCEF